MKLKQFGICLVLLSLLVSLVAGCQPQFQPGTYTDDTGRAVVINQIPQRIVSFGPSITEILFALGLEEKVVGVEDYSDYPEAAKLKPKVGNAFSPSLEKIVELEPDLVLTVKHEQLNRELDALGIKFMVLDPKDMDGIFKNIELLGKITGTEGKAEELIRDMQDSISQVVALTENVPKVRVFFIVDATDLTLPWTAGPGSFIDALITMAGGENIAAKAPGAWVQFSLEQIVSSDPEVIIIQTMPGGIPIVSKEELEEHPAWGGMTAVKQGKVYFINGDLVSRPGPRIVQGLEEMVKIIHPELFE
jgi:iron complex transport system substrate-binding protein